MAYKGFHQLFDEGHSERMTRSETKPHLLDRLQTTSTIRAAISTPKPACIITAPDTTTRQPVGSFQRTVYFPPGASGPWRVRILK